MPAKVNETEQLDGEFSQAEAVLPLQFHGNRRAIRSIEPLRRLMVAMLVDAVHVSQTKFEAPSAFNASGVCGGAAVDLLR